MDSWTVYVQADMEATEAEVRRVGELLAKGLPGADMAPAPVLGCRVRLDDEPLAPRALAAVQGLFVVAVRQVFLVQDGDVRICRVEMAQGADLGWVPRGLITHKGLADRFGVSPTWVRQLMRYKGAPAPVEVEGGNEVVYDTQLAVQHIGRVRGAA